MDTRESIFTSILKNGKTKIHGGVLQFKATPKLTHKK